MYFLLKKYISILSNEVFFISMNIYHIYMIVYYLQISYLYFSIYSLKHVLLRRYICFTIAKCSYLVSSSGADGIQSRHIFHYNDQKNKTFIYDVISYL